MDISIAKPVLMVISGLCWSVTYVSLVRNGFKDHTCGMPLFALALNFCWELLYTYSGFAGGSPDIQAWVNLVWAALDAAIVLTWVRFGRELMPEGGKDHFGAFTVLVFAACAAMQLAFYLHFPDKVSASQYSAFAQNAAMSILFLTQLMRRGDARGQTTAMAVAKCMGTLAPTLLGGLVEGFNAYILLMGAVCFVFDAIYVCSLVKMQKSRRA